MSTIQQARDAVSVLELAEKTGLPEARYVFITDDYITVTLNSLAELEAWAIATCAPIYRRPVAASSLMYEAESTVVSATPVRLTFTHYGALGAPAEREPYTPAAVA